MRSAVAAIAFGERAVVVDANVERVVARLAAIATPLPAGRSAIRIAADAVTPELRAGDFAQALMDLGSAICTPKKPRCLLCPLSHHCRAFASGTPDAFPIKAAKKARPKRFGTIFWLERNGSGGPEVLLVRRPDKGLLGGMRALPTGPWVDEAPALEGAPASANWRLLTGTVEHGFTHFTLELALAVSTGPAQGDPPGEWWPVDALATAGLPTLFARAAAAIEEGR